MRPPIRLLSYIYILDHVIVEWLIPVSWDLLVGGQMEDMGHLPLGRPERRNFEMEDKTSC